MKDAFIDGTPVNRTLRNFLTPEEYNAAKATVLNAHYTPVKLIKNMYNALQRLGFEGGNLLEPSMGTGNFFGAIPETMANNTKLYGVEIDSITGRIAKLLYPDAQIEISPYQDVNYNDGSFDVVIGNVPFLDVSYKYRNEKYMLHDYFFVKSLDKVKDGGIVMFLTSTGTLDKLNPKARNAIAERFLQKGFILSRRL